MNKARSEKVSRDVLRTDWDLEFDEDYFIIVRPGAGEECLQIYAPKNAKEREAVARLVVAAPHLLRAAEAILQDLNQRLAIAVERGGSKVPVYSGIADLREAIISAGGKVEG